MRTFWRRGAISGKTDLPSPLTETKFRIAATKTQPVVAGGATAQHEDQDGNLYLHSYIFSVPGFHRKSVERFGVNARAAVRGRPSRSTPCWPASWQSSPSTHSEDGLFPDV